MQYALFYIDFFVNNIQKNHHLTALNGDFIIVCVTFLIMLSIGLSPFLHLAKAAASLMMDACQCPLSGFLHFYMAGVTAELKKRHTVSMPFIGLSPFLLPVTKQEKQLLLQCVNALYRAFSISTLISG